MWALTVDGIHAIPSGITIQCKRAKTWSPFAVGLYSAASCPRALKPRWSCPSPTNHNSRTWRCWSSGDEDKSLIHQNKAKPDVYGQTHEHDPCGGTKTMWHVPVPISGNDHLFWATCCHICNGKVQWIRRCQAHCKATCGHECGQLYDYECLSYVSTNVADMTTNVAIIWLRMPQLYDYECRTYRTTNVAGDDGCAADIFTCPVFFLLTFFSVMSAGYLQIYRMFRFLLIFMLSQDCSIHPKFSYVPFFRIPWCSGISGYPRISRMYWFSLIFYNVPKFPTAWWAHVRVIWRSYVLIWRSSDAHLRVIRGPSEGYAQIIWGSCECHIRVMSGSSQYHLRITQRSSDGRLSFIWRSYEDHLRLIWNSYEGHFLVIGSLRWGNPVVGHRGSESVLEVGIEGSCMKASKYKAKQLETASQQSFFI